MNATVFFSCLVFLLFLAFLPTNTQPMFADPDSWWHLAAGDLIRASGAAPLHDPWSFASGDQRWLNVSWAWDSAFSFIHAQMGWYGVIISNSICIAAMLALLFAAAFVRTRDGIASFLTVGLIAATMMIVSIRSYQISFLFIAGLNLLLLNIHQRRCSLCWLLLVPPLMAIWVNLHGEFIVAFFFMGIYGLDALLRKDRPLVLWLIAIGVATLAACLVNPYGIGIIEAVMRTVGSSASPIIAEWSAFTFSSDLRAVQLYIALFLWLTLRYPQPVARPEKWLVYSWLAFGLLSIRHLYVFAIVSAPMLAMGLHQALMPKTGRPLRAPAVEALCAFGVRVSRNRYAARGMMVIALFAAALAYTPQAKQLYHFTSVEVPAMPEEIAYLQAHYPKARLLNDYGLGGPLIYYGHGTIPVFIDGRVETAYPPQTVKDFVAYYRSEEGWESMLDRYHIDGVITQNNNHKVLDRFLHRQGWRRVFSGETATIFMRDKS